MASLLGATALAANVLATVPAPLAPDAEAAEEADAEEAEGAAMGMRPLDASAPLTEGEGAWSRDKGDEAGEVHAESGKGAGSSLLSI